LAEAESELVSGFMTLDEMTPEYGDYLSDLLEQPSSGSLDETLLAGWVQQSGQRFQASSSAFGIPTWRLGSNISSQFPDNIKQERYVFGAGPTQSPQAYGRGNEAESRAHEFASPVHDRYYGASE
jgi:hypothetical protein